MNLTTIDWEYGTGLAFDALVLEAPTYEADVPTAPTQSGYVAFDCTSKATVLRLEAVVSDLGLYGDPEAGRVEAVKTKLLMLQSNGTLLKVSTDGGIWDAMVLQSLSWSRSGPASTLRFALVLRQVRLASVSVVAGAPRAGKTKRMADEAKDKKKDAEKSGKKRKSLAAHGRDTGVDTIRGWLNMGPSR